MSLAPLTDSDFDEDSALRSSLPVFSLGQIVRALALFAVFALLLAAMLLTQSGRVSAAESPGFEGFIQSLWPQAHARGVGRAIFDQATSGLTPDPVVLAKTHRQPEFAKPIGIYLATAVSPARVETGQAMAQTWKHVLERVEGHFEVDPHIVLGVWGMETNFGKFTGDLSTIRSLATLAYAHYRGDYFRRELISALVILQEGHVRPADMQGSWAGAMGQTQFMPSSFKTYAVDFEGNGRKDIWNSVPDALGSTANYLKKHGWNSAEAWGYEVRIPSGLQASAAQRAFPAWAAAGVVRADGGPMPAKGAATLLLPAGHGGPAFLVTHNFKVIKSYNNSTSYALGVALLGDRIAGWGPLRAAWPVAAR